MPCGILHPMVWGTSVNLLALIPKTIYLFVPCKLIFWKATKVGSPPNFPKLMPKLWGIPQPQYFVTSLLEPHQTYFSKHYIYHKEDTKVGSQNLAAKVAKIWLPNWVLYQTVELNCKSRLQLELELHWIERNELIRALSVTGKFWAPLGLCLHRPNKSFPNNKLMRWLLEPHSLGVNIYGISTLTQTIGGFLCRSV